MTLQGQPARMTLAEADSAKLQRYTLVLTRLLDRDLGSSRQRNALRGLEGYLVRSMIEVFGLNVFWTGEGDYGQAAEDTDANAE